MFIKLQHLSGEKIRRQTMTNSKKQSNFHFLFSTVFGLGKTNKCFSILSASIIAIPLSYIILFSSTKLLSTTKFDVALYGFFLAILILAGLTALAIYSSGIYSKQIKIKDPNEVIIDEVLGQSVSIILTVPFTFPIIIFSNLYQKFQISDNFILIVALILNIVLFRLFDSFKPWPINAFEKLKGGFGIVLDDIAAGFFAAVIYYVLLFTAIN